MTKDVKAYREALRKELTQMRNPANGKRTWTDAEVRGMMGIDDKNLKYLMKQNTPKQLAETWSM